MRAKLVSRRIVSAVTAALLTIGFVMPTFGANQYTPVNGSTMTLNKNLIMDEGDNVPNVTFSFTIAPGSARSADTSDNAVMQVLPGVGTPTVSTVTFSPSDSTSATPGSNIDVARPASERATGLTAATGVELEAGEKFASKTFTIDFSGVSFNEPGIYRYIITETANATNAAAGIKNDDDPDRVIDVYVVDDGSGSLSVAGYVPHTEDENVAISTSMGPNDVAAAGAALDDKTDGFTNERESKDLVFKNKVIGNKGSRDKWFEYTATFENVNDDDVFTVSIADDNDPDTTDGNADPTSGTTSATRPSNQNKDNPTEVTGAELKAGVKFYLQDGQSIAIRGIAPNATYTITEDEEDYKKTPSVVTGHTDPTTGVIGTVAGDNKVVYTSYQNQRDGIVPEGLKEHPEAFILAFAGMAMLAYAVGRKLRRA